MSSHRTRRPSIFQVGKVRDDGTTVTIAGWGLGLCASRCTCHKHPETGSLVIDEDQINGFLGLKSYRPCTCCGPWTANELAKILDDFAALAGIDAEGEEPASRRDEDAA